jgi:hypothetical protein
MPTATTTTPAPPDQTHLPLGPVAYEPAHLPVRDALGRLIFPTLPRLGDPPVQDDEPADDGPDDNDGCWSWAEDDTYWPHGCGS